MTPRVPTLALLDARFDRGLAACHAALAAYEAQAFARFGSAALGVVDLPDLGTAERPSRVQVQVAGALLWCREVESTGLLDFVDRLVRPVTMASLPLDGAAARRLAAYRHQARHRPTPEERRAWYALVFAPPFPEQLEGLIGGLVALHREPARARRSDTGLQVRREALAQLLSRRVHGSVQYGIGAVVQHVQDARSVLQHPSVRRGLGGGPQESAFAVLARHAPRVLGRTVEPHRALRRAASGATLVHWIGGRSPAHRGAAVVEAAERWVAA